LGGGGVGDLRLAIGDLCFAFCVLRFCFEFGVDDFG